MPIQQREQQTASSNVYCPPRYCPVHARVYLSPRRHESELVIRSMLAIRQRHSTARVFIASPAGSDIPR